MKIMKSIKMIFLVMLTAALFFGGATFAEQAAVITAHDYLGEWVDQDGTTNIEIEAHHEEGNYIVNVQIDEVDSEKYDYIVWAYGCVWDEESGALKSVFRVAGTGKYDADDEEISDFNEDYADAVFSLNGEGLLVWEDREINAGEGRTFELVPVEKTEAADEAEPTGSIITPNNAPIKRHPNGVMPNSAMPAPCSSA